MMMVADVVATCLRCGADVPVSSIWAARRRSRDHIQVAYTCTCGRKGARYFTQATADAALAQAEGRPSRPTAEDILLRQWRNDLGGDLTVEVFENQWKYNERKGKTNAS